MIKIALKGLLLFSILMIALTYLLLNVGNFLVYGYNNPTIGLIVHGAIAAFLSVSYILYKETKKICG